MINKMLDTLEEPLTQELIKRFHYELKSGVFEDSNRNEYLESLKEYRSAKSLNKLINFFEEEQPVYLEKCKYYM